MDILHVLEDHPRQWEAEMLYRRHPREGWQFWTQLGWANSGTYYAPDGPSPGHDPHITERVVNWEDTWCEPEEEG